MDRRNSRETGKIVSLVFTMLFLALALSIIRLFGLDIMRVEGHSMEPTLRPSQMILVNHQSCGIILPFFDRYLLMRSRPQTGDVVILRNRINGKTFVKLCIAGKGDPIGYKDGYPFASPGKIQLETSFPFEILPVKACSRGRVI